MSARSTFVSRLCVLRCLLHPAYLAPVSSSGGPGSTQQLSLPDVPRLTHCRISILYVLSIVKSNMHGGAMLSCSTVQCRPATTIPCTQSSFCVIILRRTLHSECSLYHVTHLMLGRFLRRRNGECSIFHVNMRATQLVHIIASSVPIARWELRMLLLL